MCRKQTDASADWVGWLLPNQSQKVIKILELARSKSPSHFPHNADREHDHCCLLNIMSLYSQGFALLPRPARSALSIGNEASRAQLPDFANVEQLTTFVTRLFQYDFAVPGFFLQLKVGASVICFLIFVVLATISRRMYDKSFWVVRIMKRPSGSVIVPNAMLCFSIIEGIYGTVFVAFCWCISQIYESKRYAPINIPLWLLLPWCPLIVGATWAAWGTFFATPSKKQISSYIVEERPGKIHRLFHHAITINCMGLFIPLLICISVTVPAVFATIRFNDAHRQQVAWLALYADQTQFTQAMVQEAQTVWYNLLSAMLIVSATYIVWVFWALLMCIAYSWIAIRLIRSIRSELRKSKADGPRIGVVATTRMMSVNDDADAAEQDIEAHNERVQGDERQVRTNEPLTPLSPSMLQATNTPVTSNATAYRKASVASAKTAVNTGRLAALEDEDDGVFKAIAHFDDEEKKGEATPVKVNSIQSNSPQYVQHANDGVVEEPRKTMIPNLIMRNNHASITTAPVSRDTQAKELRKAFIHICIQFFAVSPACIAFMAIALLLAVTSYGGTEQPWNGGTLVERMLAIALVSVVWVTCFFGTITLVAIAQRTYEPVFHNLTLNNTFSASVGQSSSGGRNRNEKNHHLSSPRSGRQAKRKSLMSMSNILSGVSRRPTQKQHATHDRHAMSTFFETHTRRDAHQSARDQPSPSSSSQRLHNGREMHASSADVESYTNDRRQSAYDDKDNREELHGEERGSLDIAHRGLFIERTTIVHVEEDSSNYHDVDPSPSATFANQTKSPSFASAAAHQFASNSSQQQHRISSNHNIVGDIPSSQDASQAQSYDYDDSIVDTANSHGISGRLSDDDDTYFRGGTGRRSRTSRQGRQQNATFAIGYAQ
jgi:hypothetical protein